MCSASSIGKNIRRDARAAIRECREGDGGCEGGEEGGIEDGSLGDLDGGILLSNRIIPELSIRVLSPSMHISIGIECICMILSTCNSNNALAHNRTVSRRR